MRNIVLAFITVTACPLAHAAFLQKTVQIFALDDPRVPAEALAKSDPQPWLNAERGPVPGLKLLARERFDSNSSGSDAVQSTGNTGGAFWLGGQEGAAQFDPSAKLSWDRWQYFAGPRWLKDDHVRNIVVSTNPRPRSVWIRTDNGVSLIEWRPTTLEGKAAHFEELIERHHLRHGFVADCRLREAGDLESSYTIDNDNDGLWTAMYLGAESYRFAVTGDREARAHADRAFNALVRLLDITGNPGFPARSIAAAGEAHDNGEWHPTPDGKWWWKGDTSSDELVGHYFGHALFYDLVASESQKATVRRVIRAITDHLIEHDYELIDLDGRPTRWGRWSERYFATEEGSYEKALRSLELLSFLKTAYHITGDQKYDRAYRDRIDHGFARYLSQYRRWPGDGEINFSDDELAYLSIDPLLRYEHDPALRGKYLDEVRFIWNAIRSDRNPLWNYIAAAGGAGPLTTEIQTESRKTLERIPWLPIDWAVHNSRRIDVQLRRQSDRFGRTELKDALPPDERPQEKWNGDPYVPDSDGNGHFLECGTYFLLPYWMGRYHGWITD